MPENAGRLPSILEGQRLAVERLKSSLYGTDPYVHSRYIQDFHREFSGYRSVVPRLSLLEACRGADIVFVGDYHALPSCQSFAADLLEYIAAHGHRVLLFLEMVFSRDQPAVDRLLAGQIDERAFKRLIRYDREWGYPWEGYGRLLRVAKDAGAGVIASDAPPRGGLRVIRRRDRHAAVKIVEAIEAEPRSKAIVLFGESHVAGNHLPRDVRAGLARAGLSRRSVVVVQNVEDVYWDLAARRKEDAEAVRIDRSRFVVLNASPLAKYEAYRQTLLRWAQQQDEFTDYLPSVHHLIDLLAGLLRLDPYRARVRAGNGRVVALVDLYPDVVTRRDRRVPLRRGHRPRRMPALEGAAYRPAPNRIDVFSFSIAAAAAAAAAFLLAALSGRAGRPASAGGDPGSSSPRTVSGRTTRGTRLRSGGLPRTLGEAFTEVAVLWLDPGGSLKARAPRRGVRNRVSSSAVAGSAIGAAQALGIIEGNRAGVGGVTRMPSGSGSTLGRAIYGRLREGGEIRRLRAWLLAVARCGAATGTDSEAEALKLFSAGVRLAGWADKKTGRAPLR